MYIVIFAGEDKDYVLELKTLSEVLERTIKIIDVQGQKESTKIYDSREAFLEVIEELMQECYDGYVIGVDVDKNTFEIMHLKYDWVYSVVEKED